MDKITKNFSYSDATIIVAGTYSISPNLSNNTYNVSISYDITNANNYTTTAYTISSSVTATPKGSYDLVYIEGDVTFLAKETKHFEGNVNIPYNIDGTLPTTNRISVVLPWSDGSSGNIYALRQNLNEIMTNLSNGHMNINNTWKKGYFWKKINGVWKRCLIWKKINGIWKKGI